MSFTSNFGCKMAACFSWIRYVRKFNLTTNQMSDQPPELFANSSDIIVVFATAGKLHVSVRLKFLAQFMISAYDQSYFI
jgi:hypothetical protein